MLKLNDAMRATTQRLTVPRLLVGLFVGATFSLVGACSGLDQGSDNEGSGGTGAATGGSGNGAGGDSADPCDPGTVNFCWETREGEPLDGKPPVGDQTTCRRGQQLCQADATWGPCVGAVGPAPMDSCEAGNDANCNGTPNEGCPCTDGDTRACGSDVGNCMQGVQACVGEQWGDCEGAVVAAAVDGCDEGDDANCNGTPNEDCACQDDETMPCTADGGGCTMGTKTCVNGVWPDACNCESDAGVDCASTPEGCCGDDGACGGDPCTTFYVDNDGDGWAPDDVEVQFCGTSKAGYVAVEAADGTSDCNDDVDTVNPAGVEVCNGLDDDCSGTLDTEDGLDLVNAVADVGPVANLRSQPEIAWSPTASVYGIAYNQSTSPAATYFTILNQAGTQQVAPTEAGTESIGNGLHVVWGDSTFGLTWFDSSVKFRTIGTNGSLGVIRTIINGPMAKPQVGRVGSGNWAVSYIDYGSGSGLVGAKTVSSAGAVGSHVDITTVNSNYGLLIGTSAGFVTAVELAGSSSEAKFFNSSLGSPASLVVEGQAPAMGAGIDGFGIAVGRTAARPEFYSFDAAGDARCGPVPFADTNFAPSDLVGTDAGYLVVSSGAIRAQLIKPDCSLGPLFVVDDSVSGSAVRVAGGSEGYGVVYTITGPKVKRRFFGPNFCD